MKPQGYREHLLRQRVFITPEQDAACRYLESRGLEFQVEFVVSSAVAEARLLFEYEQPASGFVN